MGPKTLLTALLIPALVVLCMKPGKAESDQLEAYSMDGFYEQLDPYIQRYHDPSFPYERNDLRGKFSYQPGEAFDLYGTADMVYLLWVIDELEERTTPEGREEWIALIQSYQDPETGWFSKGNETLHFKSHATAYATGALSLLGAEPLYPFKWKTRMTKSEKATARWLEQIWWDVVWVGSHEGGGVAASLAMTGEAPDQWFDWYLDWLDREVNPNTGLWQRAFYNVVIKKPNMNDMGGAAHFWWIYQWRGRPIPYPEKVIDTCLSLQLESGLWDKKLIKGDFPYCINCDAINGINLAYFHLSSKGRDYRGDDIRASFERFLSRSTGVLSTPGNIEKLYDNSHDLPGALIGLAEADKFFRLTEGEGRLKTRKPWRTVLGTICWL